MSSPNPTSSDPKPCCLQPLPISMPRRISFGNTPVPDRSHATRETSKSISSTSSKTSELHRTLSEYVASKSTANSILDQFVPAEKMKSISDLDKEEEVRMKKKYEQTAKKGIPGVMRWTEEKINGTKQG